MTALASMPARRELIGELQLLSDRMLEILKRPAVLADLACRADAVEFVERLRNEVALLPRGGPQRGLTRWQLQRVTGYMLERLDQPHSLRDLAALLRLSRWHFCTAFRLASGLTPREWLITQRMQKARQLLLQTRYSITQIALAVGYRSPSAFSVQFRRSAGMKPTSFRRQR
jgi:AraC family transcriptional regulator